jgi:hypothetical protein
MKGSDVTHESEQEEKCGTAFHSQTVGLNDNLDFMGRMLHVQTEHTEFPTARITTQVFCNGRVLLSKKSECAPGIRESQDIHGLQQTMNAQHRQVIREILDKQTRILGSRQQPANT